MVMSAPEEVLTVTEFKARCLEFFDRLSSHRLQKVTVTRRGKPVAVVSPPATQEADLRALHGSMAGSVIIPPGFDLTAPVFDGELDAEKGILHR
jgi:antitoxin (DNA-binding transcriptional repressor) of toxin-antitoxin stability system